MAFMLITAVVAAIYSIGWVYLPAGNHNLVIFCSIILLRRYMWVRLDLKRLKTLKNKFDKTLKVLSLSYHNLKYLYLYTYYLSLTYGKRTSDDSGRRRRDA